MDSELTAVVLPPVTDTQQAAAPVQHEPVNVPVVTTRNVVLMETDVALTPEPVVEQAPVSVSAFAPVEVAEDVVPTVETEAAVAEAAPASEDQAFPEIVTTASVSNMPLMATVPEYEIVPADEPVEQPQVLAQVHPTIRIVGLGLFGNNVDTAVSNQSTQIAMRRRTVPVNTDKWATLQAIEAARMVAELDAFGNPLRIGKADPAGRKGRNS